MGRRSNLARVNEKMRLAPLIVLGMLPMASGCAEVALRHETVDQASTLTDLQFQMVLENLAMFAANPGTMPWHINVTGGTTQLTDSAQGQMLFGANLYNVFKNSFYNIAPGANASRTLVEQWGHSPVTDGDELRLLRFAYRRALGYHEMPTPDFLDDLGREIKKQVVSTEDLKVESLLFYQELFLNKNKSYDAMSQVMDSTVGEKKFPSITNDPLRSGRKTPLAREVESELKEIVDELKKIGPGWYGIGRKHDVPKEAVYVGHYKHIYVWVCPSGVEKLTEFTLSVLEMASAIHPPSAFQFGAGGVNYSPGFDTSF